MNILNIKFLNRFKQEKTLSDYPAKYYLIVNTASKCGLTPQFTGLEAIHQHFKDQGLVTLGFPCGQFAGQELATGEEANQFCKLNYGVTFEIMDKLKVNGKEAAPLFTNLKAQMADDESERIKWNFTKFIVNSEGEVIARFSPKTEPKEVEAHISTLFQ